jgi:ABC-type transport system substrate-binding protein
MERRSLLAGAAAWPLLGRATASAMAAPSASASASPRTLRVAFNFAETGFDPPRVGDQSSIRVIAHIFEPPLAYDPLARPAVLVPLTAANLPEVSADFRRFVVTLKPGILFADDPVFQGRPRELVAADYVYTLKRFYDPAIRTEHLYRFENAKILGLSELRKRAIKDKSPFPYDTEVPGLRTLDRYRFEIVLADPAPRFAHQLAEWICGAVAREVVEAYTDDPMAHPVGTGPFRLAQWRRASRIVLERNPRFREQRFATVGAGDELHLKAAAKQLEGARAPLLDRVEIDIIDESQPRWLAFLRGEHDVLTLPPDFGELAMPGGRLAPFLARQGVQARRELSPATSHTFFNFDDPLVGGYTPEKVALRRAIALAFDSAEEVRLVLRGQAAPAQGMISPHCYGHDPALKSEMGTPSVARARALLDMHGYTDRNGDGWREQPDGRPLLLRRAFPPDQRSRAASELWLKRLKAVGLRVQFEFAPFGELIRRSLAGQLMMWGFIWSNGSPDGDFFLGLAYGPNADQSNDARFQLPAFDRLYERQRVLPDGPERLALMQRAHRFMLAYVPYIAHNHPITTDLLHAHVSGPLRHPFGGDWWRWAEVGLG